MSFMFAARYTLSVAATIRHRSFVTFIWAKMCRMIDSKDTMLQYKFNFSENQYTKTNFRLQGKETDVKI